MEREGERDRGREIERNKQREKACEVYRNSVKTKEPYQNPYQRGQRIFYLFLMIKKINNGKKKKKKEKKYCPGHVFILTRMC